MTLKDLKWERICSSYFVDPICFVGILKFSWYEVHRQLEDVNAVFRSWNVEKRLGYFIFNNSGFIKKTWLFFVCEKGLVIETGKENKKNICLANVLWFSPFLHPVFVVEKNPPVKFPLAKSVLSWHPWGQWPRPRIRSTITTNIFYFSFIPEKAAAVVNKYGKKLWIFSILGEISTTFKGRI